MLCTTLPMLVSVESSCCNEVSAADWLVLYCASVADWLLSCTACAAPSGSSDAVWILLPDEICAYCAASDACWSLIVWTFIVKYCELEIRIVKTSVEDAKQCLEQRRSRLDDLAVGLIKLLVLNQVGGFLVQVHARNGLLRRCRLVQHRRCRRARCLQRVRLVADLVDEVGVGTGQGVGAAVHRLRGA